MSPAEHYREAERLIDSIEDVKATALRTKVSASLAADGINIVLALAQVHATLATVDRTTTLEAGNLSR